MPFEYGFHFIQTPYPAPITMKKAYALLGILFAVIATNYLVAEERERREGNRERAENNDGELREWIDKKRHHIEELKKAGKHEEAKALQKMREPSRSRVLQDYVE